MFSCCFLCCVCSTLFTASPKVHIHARRQHVERTLHSCNFYLPFLQGLGTIFMFQKKTIKNHLRNHNPITRCASVGLHQGLTLSSYTARSPGALYGTFLAARSVSPPV
ncbi:hypothetical protein XENOCAPTIV_030012 [Xenoophorus captivus]|uniref:C2H2-type domain-containing protein n=1 Tax=Xenoophorus captivus TaxID=1517983 RepID=A0ABV0SDB6_9TELE